MSELIKLDIACGQTKREGFKGVDIAACEGVDFVHNLTQYPWPFADASVEEAHCSHYIEHIPMCYWNEGNEYTINPKDEQSKEAFLKFMDEVYRILVPGGKIQIVAPYYNSMRCWQDPTHRRAISDASFHYLSKTWREACKLTHYRVDCDFDCAGGYAFSREWAIRHPEAQMGAARNYTNVVDDIWVTLTKK